MKTFHSVTVISTCLIYKYSHKLNNSQLTTIIFIMLLEGAISEQIKKYHANISSSSHNKIKN